MGDLYTCSINIRTREMEENHFSGPDYEDYPVYESEEEAGFLGGAGYATFNADGFENVYAESVVSAKDARRLVYEKCLRFIEDFAACLNSLEGW